MEEMEQLPSESTKGYLERFRIYLRQLRYEADLAVLSARHARRRYMSSVNHGNSRPLVLDLLRDAEERVRAAGVARGRVDIAEAAFYARSLSAE